MKQNRQNVVIGAAIASVLFLICLDHAHASDTQPVPGQLRIFTCGHSFHAFIGKHLSEVEALTDIKGHFQVGNSMIGASKAIKHWDVPDEKNEAKKTLTAGQVDVLTLSALETPDEGIDKFATLGLKHNPNIRVLLQEFWLLHDKLDGHGDKSYGELTNTLRNWSDPVPADPKTAPSAANDPAHPKHPDTACFDVPTADQLEKLHAPYFERMNAYVVEENKKFGKQVIFVVPDGQAIIALRRKITEGKAPGISKQSDLFVDKSGHPNSIIDTLSAYCHFSVIYRKSPIGLPLPQSLAKNYTQELNLLLQQIAWDAVIHHPLSGVSAKSGK